MLQVEALAHRTTALPLGRGAFTLATSCTLLTEALIVPKLVLAGRLPAQQNATACWCHMANSSEAVLCILQVDALTEDDKKFMRFVLDFVAQNI
ncbi:hypothetical protein BVRB_014980 [Beta vulgaris subsp. vulgaris]|uniref:Uncharacterized protein n=1 Tax=Beta vulgaris subsp. vulgaris TaxID=3555 RepID=A0A0J8B1D2_BETVV|nr:hypothetical protein BVRB_014980 [Beta vulgaris subsp. vulgaris]